MQFKARDVRVKNDERLVEVDWADGATTRVPITRLRGYCPCAGCQGHGGALQYIDNDAHGIVGAEPVGRYAILFKFSDGHDTGIYRWEQLRKLSPDEADRWGRPEDFMRQG